MNINKSNVGSIIDQMIAKYNISIEDISISIQLVFLEADCPGSETLLGAEANCWGIYN